MNTASDSATLKEQVRSKYRQIAREGSMGCGCGSASFSEGYDTVEGHEAGADLGLGCGLPTEHANLAPGQTVLDLGSGAGVDAFVARRIVGETGRVLGVDFSPEMNERARENAHKLRYENVEFLDGEIEDLPLKDETVDVIISNCVLNLVPDKARAFSEMARVLRPGGHFCISDIVSQGTLPQAVREAAELYAGCVSGAMEQEAYLALLRESGFEEVKVVQERSVMPSSEVLASVAPEAAEALLDQPSGSLLSITVCGTRPHYS